MEKRTNHHFEYGHSVFTFRCSCGEDLEINNPNFGTECACGRYWKFRATVVCNDERDDDDVDDDDYE